MDDFKSVLIGVLTLIMRLIGMGASTLPGDEQHDPEPRRDWRDQYLSTKDRQR